MALPAMFMRDARVHFQVPEDRYGRDPDDRLQRGAPSGRLNSPFLVGTPGAFGSSTVVVTGRAFRRVRSAPNLRDEALASQPAPSFTVSPCR